MGTDHELSALIGRYLNALEEADRLQVDGFIDEAQKQRNKAASLVAAIDGGWSSEAIQAAYRQQMDAIFADWQSAHERCTARSAVRQNRRYALS